MSFINSILAKASSIAVLLITYLFLSDILIAIHNNPKGIIAASVN
jgi:hypothetical protein